MLKNSRMMSAAMVMRTCFESWKRLEKKSGTVIALPAFSEYLRRRLATNFQLRYVPMTRPMAVHMASDAPVKYAMPGRPMSSQPDMSEASAESAVSHGPRPRPPRKYSSLDEFERFA